MRSRRFGEHALLVECVDATEVAGCYARLLSEQEALGAAEVVPAARTVLLDGLRDPGAVAERIAGWEPEARGGPESRVEVEIPVSYDGVDLDEVARQWQTTAADVVRIHTAARFVVAFCGFAPGFAYCTGLPDGLTVARRAEPRASVPAGSVALAGEFTGVYPAASPGGWQLIGRTEVRLWRPDREQPALLSPGTSVRFRDASSFGSSIEGFAGDG